eukprot:6431888-Pyramimonas_sp.AAC.1
MSWTTWVPILAALKSSRWLPRVSSHARALCPLPGPPRQETHHQRGCSFRRSCLSWAACYWAVGVSLLLAPLLVDFAWVLDRDRHVDPTPLALSGHRDLV